MTRTWQESGTLAVVFDPLTLTIDGNTLFPDLDEALRNTVGKDVWTLILAVRAECFYDPTGTTSNAFPDHHCERHVTGATLHRNTVFVCDLAADLLPGIEQHFADRIDSLALEG